MSGADKEQGALKGRLAKLAQTRAFISPRISFSNLFSLAAEFLTRFLLCALFPNSCSYLGGSISLSFLVFGASVLHLQPDVRAGVPVQRHPSVETVLKKETAADEAPAPERVRVEEGAGVRGDRVGRVTKAQLWGRC